ncbi:hypothetical protein BDV36DRAFT_276010 [Aspergillus pseudocaelatus]|uniref:Uncharacterized protein n=1 Tax=Aspergillus pseudocaelatus TaxID=1825620 RepID=A0ABQ6W1M4_9EURO|nr:hypothetical protein BDV36DRAFT_276010 [Aspergillus pseudocaelatus]
MFAPGQETLSKEQIRAGEEEAQQTIRSAITGGILLYLCEFCRLSSVVVSRCLREIDEANKCIQLPSLSISSRSSFKRSIIRTVYVMTGIH